MNVVVLAGGLSGEREVSLSSGGMVCRALRQAGYNAILVDVFMGVESLPDPIEDVFTQLSRLDDYQVQQQAPDIQALKALHGQHGLVGGHVAELCQKADIVFMGLHGEDGENGRLQAMFDVLGIRYTGSGYFGSALAMDKWIAKQILIRNGISTPDCHVFRQDEPIDIGQIPLPCVVKPCCGGSSIGVQIARSRTELADALEQAFLHEREILAEQYIAGREFSVGVLGGNVLPVIEIKPRNGFYDYAHKYQKGWAEEICPAELPEQLTREMQRLALRAFHALKLEVYARIDFMMDEREDIYCLEANTLPGMTPTSLLPQEAQAIGLDYSQLCTRIIQLSMQKYGGS